MEHCNDFDRVQNSRNILKCLHTSKIIWMLVRKPDSVCWSLFGSPVVGVGNRKIAMFRTELPSQAVLRSHWRTGSVSDLARV
jgi:hypothetical protein